MLEAKRALHARATVRTARLRRLWPVALVSMDLVQIYAAFMLAYWLRYALKLGPQIHDQLAFRDYQPLALLLIGTLVPVLLLKGAYRRRLSGEVSDELSTIVSSVTTAVAAIVVVTAMVHRYEYSRGVIVYVWALAILMLVVGRGVLRSLQRVCHRHGWGVHRLLVVGSTQVGKMIMQNVVNRPDMGYDLIGFVEHREAAPVQNFGRFRVLGTLADVDRLVDELGVDDIVIALPASHHEQMWQVVSHCERRGVALKLVPDLFEMSLSRVQMDDINGIPVLDVRENPARMVARGIKRAVDVMGASLLLLPAAPVIAMLAVLVRLESRGPALFRQPRVGWNGRLFGMLKLRSMYAGADSMKPSLLPLNDTDGPLFKMRQDPRITRVGRFMRRWSLDEFPQLWNVLVGDMSLVGPRPALPQEVEQYQPWQLRRLEVRPGLTGLWQVSGRSELGFDEMVVMDSFYVDNWSPALDLKILMRTVLAVLTRRGAY